jgi:hypothetical protein
MLQDLQEQICLLNSLCNLLNDTVIDSKYAASNDYVTVNNTTERVWNETVLVQLKTLTGIIPGGTEENHEENHQPIHLSPAHIFTVDI